LKVVLAETFIIYAPLSPVSNNVVKLTSGTIIANLPLDAITIYSVPLSVVNNNFS
jgi:hypothetical protein